MENTKVCSKCGRELPLSEFNKCKSRKDGLQPYCKECKKQHAKQWRADNPQYFKQYWKQYYADNADAIKQYIKQWRADNADAIKEWRANNAEHLKQYWKQYYATIEGYARNVRKNNLKADRKQGRIGANEDPLPSIEQYIELLQQRDYYDGKQYHWSEMGLDRIDNSKPHTIDNVVPCCTAHNRQRGRKSFEEFCELIQKMVS